VWGGLESAEVLALDAAEELPERGEDLGDADVLGAVAGRTMSA
jgi:hypothetical protein